MLYEHDLTVPANTPMDDPAVFEMTLDDPVITDAECYFPPGVEGLAHGSVWYGEYRMWPHPAYDWATGNGNTAEGPVHFESGEDEPAIVLKGYNEDDTYPHTLYFRIVAYPRNYAYWRETLTRISSFLKRLTGGRI